VPTSQQPQMALLIREVACAAVACSSQQHQMLCAAELAVRLQYINRSCHQAFQCIVHVPQLATVYWLCMHSTLLWLSPQTMPQQSGPAQISKCKLKLCRWTVYAAVSPMQRSLLRIHKHTCCWCCAAQAEKHRSLQPEQHSCNITPQAIPKKQSCV
jgi:hypothetical protein